MVPCSSYSTSTILTKLLYIALYITLQVIQIYPTVINLQKINKLVSHSLKHLCQWLTNNKISLNAKKTEIIMFKHKQTIITKHMIFRVSGKKINTITGAKYLGVYQNDSLTWETFFKNLILKLNRTIRLLSKIRHCTPKFLLKTIYYSLLILTLFIQPRFGGKQKQSCSRRW